MDRDQLPFVLMAVVGIILIVVGQVGERLGWWNDTGQALTLAGWSRPS